MEGNKTYTFNPRRIAELQKKHGLSDIEFARKAGLTRQQVQQWKAGDSKPNTASLAAMAHTFSTDINYFFTRTDHQIDRQAARV